MKVLTKEQTIFESAIILYLLVILSPSSTSFLHLILQLSIKLCYFHYSCKNATLKIEYLLLYERISVRYLR